MRLFLPIILIGISTTLFFLFANPFYKEVGDLRAQVASFNEALDNSKSLEKERDKLTAKNNSFDPANLEKLKKLLPENVDNIRLILEIEKIALPYGMTLKDIKYSATESLAAKGAANGAGTVQGGNANIVAPVSPKDYGVWDLEFSTTGTYNNFLNFSRDLESNLRIVDVASIQFSSETSAPSGSVSSVSPGSYTYNFKIKTYWLKN